MGRVWSTKHGCKDVPAIKKTQDQGSQAWKGKETTSVVLYRHITVLQYISCTVASNISAISFPHETPEKKKIPFTPPRVNRQPCAAFTEPCVSPLSPSHSSLTSVSFYFFISAIRVTGKSTEQYSWYKEEGIKVSDKTKFQPVIEHYWGPGEKTAASTTWTDQWMTDLFTDLAKLQ